MEKYVEEAIQAFVQDYLKLSPECVLFTCSELSSWLGDQDELTVHQCKTIAGQWCDLYRVWLMGKDMPTRSVQDTQVPFHQLARHLGFTNNGAVKISKVYEFRKEFLDWVKVTTNG